MDKAKHAQDAARLELEMELTKSKERIATLEHEAAKQLERQETAAEQSLSPPSPPAPSSSSSNSGLDDELVQARRLIEELRRKLAELTKAATQRPSATPNPADDGGKEGFGAFIEMKRENQVLRAQIKDLMRTQQRILGGSAARRVEPGRGLRRKGRR